MRILVPEILDSLHSSNPEAIRSRRDLRMINRLMGNNSWIRNQLASSIDEIDTVIELGAGDGSLLNQLAAVYPNKRFIGIDLIAEPTSLNSNVTWLQTDLFNTKPEDLINSKTLVIANLILHHFSTEQLESLRFIFSNSHKSVIVEPHRSKVAQCLAYTLFPIINRVTKHDMIVSIKAGFRKNELTHLIAPDAKSCETATLFGGLRITLHTK